MAKKAKKNKDVDYPKVTTPKGKALYPFLFKPQTKFDEEGKFKISVVLDIADAEVKDFLTAIKKFNDENGGGKLPYTVDKEAGIATVNFKSSKQPVVKDAECNVIEVDPKVANNSTVRASGRLSYYDGFGGGTTIYLNAVQVIDLIVYEPDDGFKKEEGGYCNETVAAASGSDDFEDESPKEPEATSPKADANNAEVEAF